jgi:hypothetical protein
MCGTIAPAEGSTIEEYDPWAAFTDNEGQYRTVQQPYAPMLDLARELATLEERGVRPYECHSRNFLGEPERGPRNEADAAILAWVNEHGLLGVLPVIASAIRGPVEQRPVRDGVLEFSRQMHFRHAGEWVARKLARTYYFETPEGARADAKSFEGEGPPPGASILTWHRGPEEKPLLPWVRDYFLPVLYGPARTRPDTFSPPCPGSREFMEAYCEPVPEFAVWVRNFRLAVDALNQWEKPADEAAQDRAAEGHWFIAALTQGAAPLYAFHNGRTVEARLSAGLLASYALMHLWDRMDGRRAIECALCRKYFVSDEPRAAYCSATCRNTASKRRARARKSDLSGE